MFENNSFETTARGQFLKEAEQTEASSSALIRQQIEKEPDSVKEERFKMVELISRALLSMAKETKN